MVPVIWVKEEAQLSLACEELGWGWRVIFLKQVGQHRLALTFLCVKPHMYVISFNPENSFVRSNCCCILYLTSMATKLGKITDK